MPGAKSLRHPHKKTTKETIKIDMIKKTLLLAMLALPMVASAQYTFDALQYSQTQLRGTSRFVSMGGAFGALGGDISVLSQNPGGIGVYRSSDLSFTGGVDLLSSSCTGESVSHNKFFFDNVGYVGSFKTNSDVLPNFNFGFSYNRINSFRRHYNGAMANIPTSVTNYLAEKAMQDGMSRADMEATNPYFDGNARWDQIAAFKADLIGTSDADGKKFSGLGYDGVYGTNEFEVDEWGHTDEYNMSFGGNLYNKVYWGVSVAFTEIIYESYKYYGEVLNNTVVVDEVGGLPCYSEGNAALGIVNSSRTVGTGINGKFGVIYKPVNELRLGLAVHTPTFYNMKDVYSGNISAEYYGEKMESPYTVEAKYPSNTVFYDIRTPWKLIGSVAAVVGGKGIVSVDYEYTDNQSMRISDDYGHELLDATSEIKTYLKPTHTMRLGGEYRVTPNISLRAGYSFQTTGTEDIVQNDKVEVEVSGTNPAYSYDTSNQYITAGLGFHSGGFYADLAYVNQQRKSNYHAFSGISDLPTVKTEVKDNNNRIQATVGFRF